MESLETRCVLAAVAPPTIFLQAASNSGSKNDTVTSVRAPVFVGAAPVGSSVILQVDGGGERRIATNPRTGRWSFAAPALADGVHAISARAVTARGGASTTNTLSLTIDGVRPMAKLQYLPLENVIEATFSRPVTGLSLGQFTVSGIVYGASRSLPITHPWVVQATNGGFVLEPKEGAVPGTVYRIRSRSGDVFGGDIRVTLVVPPRGIVEIASGAENPLGPTSNAYGPNVRGNPFCVL